MCPPRILHEPASAERGSPSSSPSNRLPRRSDSHLCSLRFTPAHPIHTFASDSHLRSLVPAYCFGENQLFTMFGFARTLQLWVLRKLRVGLPLFTGKWGLPFGPPLPTHTMLVIGREVAVGPPNADPTEAEIEAVFERFVAELWRIFDENAAKYLPADVAARGLRVERIGVGVVNRSASPPPPNEIATAQLVSTQSVRSRL